MKKKTNIIFEFCRKVEKNFDFGKSYYVLEKFSLSNHRAKIISASFQFFDLKVSVELYEFNVKIKKTNFINSWPEVPIRFVYKVE